MASTLSGPPNFDPDQWWQPDKYDDPEWSLEAELFAAVRQLGRQFGKTMEELASRAEKVNSFIAAIQPPKAVTPAEKVKMFQHPKPGKPHGVHPGVGRRGEHVRRGRQGYR